MTTAYIGLGSNLDEPGAQLQRASLALEALADPAPVRFSPVYRSAAVGPGEQPDYLNAVAAFDTDMDAHDLLAGLQAIENAQGRVRDVRWEARTLDLDLLLYGTDIIASATLVVPHPRMAGRDFVLHPLQDLAGPNLMLPGDGNLGTLVADCPRGELVKTSLQLGGGQRLPGRETSGDKGP